MARFNFKAILSYPQNTPIAFSCTWALIRVVGYIVGETTSGVVMECELRHPRGALGLGEGLDGIVIREWGFVWRVLYFRWWCICLCGSTCGKQV